MSTFEWIIQLVYVLAASCFVLGLHLMNTPATARRGNQVSIAGMVAGDTGFTADVRLASPSGRPLAGMVEVLDGQGVSALTYTWLATSCASPQDTLDLLARVSVLGL